MRYKKRMDIKKWKFLKKIDQDVTWNIKNCVSNLIRFSGIARNHGMTAVKNVTLAGSACESTVLSRAFLVEEKYLEGGSFELEFDLEFILIELPKFLKKRVEKSEMNGFARLRLTLDEAFKLSLENGWNFPSEYKQNYSNIMLDGYISSSEMKKVLKQRFQYKHDGKFIEAFVALCFNKSVRDIELECVHPGVLTKSSVMTKIILRVEGETILEVSYDAVALIKLLWWPEAAQEWLTRRRIWPSKEDVKKLSSHCFIIPKPLTQHQIESPVYEKSERNMDFRYTFSHIERELMSMFSEQQMLVYFLFKSIFYKHVKTLKPDVIQSYCCKTVMLWTCEKFDPGSLFWDENWKSTIQAVVYLFKELLVAFREGTLHHYFIQEINVIDNIPIGLQKTLTQKIEAVILDIYDFIPQNVKDTSKFGCFMNDKFLAMNQVKEILAMKKNFLWLILRRPLFTANLIYCFTFHTYYLYYLRMLMLIFVIVLGLVFLCMCDFFNGTHF